MKHLRTTFFLMVLIALRLDAEEVNWPEFRGPSGNGTTTATNLPSQWSEQQNVKWKTPIHDRGWSSPVVWGQQLWLTTATTNGHELFALCIDRDTGKVIRDLKLFE
ncbi:MAG: PQQ-binding-like beta-propeller repeat protein, partial [Verrucomicrobia bacterium]|nr:PQQ-binding-like beta-propeller repeat protein [Verrucomicrobiota bacterium]